MIKNLLVLALLTWVSLSYARMDVTLSKESLKEAEAYKVQNSSPGQEATRSVAGGKMKKKVEGPKAEVPKEEQTTDGGSEVRYWQYSE